MRYQRASTGKMSRLLRHDCWAGDFCCTQGRRINRGRSELLFFQSEIVIVSQVEQIRLLRSLPSLVGTVKVLGWRISESLSVKDVRVTVCVRACTCAHRA